VTKTHTLRVPSTSDVWVTEVKNVKVPVTVQTTRRSYRPEAANTVTSYVRYYWVLLVKLFTLSILFLIFSTLRRVTNTEVSVVTRTVEIVPTKTVVSVFTRFVTETSSVELWQPLVHMATSYEVRIQIFY